MTGSFRFAKVLGIELRIHVSWILIFAYVTLTLSQVVFPEDYPLWSDEKTLLVGVVAAVLFFASVVAHELAHSLVARAYRMEVSSITLFLLGGVANLTKEPVSARAEFLMAAAGPATSFLIGGLGLLVANVVDAPGLEPVQAIAGELGAVNIALGIFNLVPGFPLDGGRVLRSIIWGIRKDRAAATRLAARGGQAVAALLAFGGLLLFSRGGSTTGLWYLLIAYFLYNAASGSLAQERAAAAVQGARVAELMTIEPRVVTSDLTVGTLIQDVLLPHELRSVAVVDGGILVGYVVTDDLRVLPHERWAVTRVAEIMHDASTLGAVEAADPLLRAVERFGETPAPFLPVHSNGAIVGLLSRESVAGYIQMRESLGLA